MYHENWLGDGSEIEDDFECSSFQTPSTETDQTNYQLEFSAKPKKSSTKHSQESLINEAGSVLKTPKPRRSTNVRSKSLDVCETPKFPLQRASSSSGIDVNEATRTSSSTVNSSPEDTSEAIPSEVIRTTKLKSWKRSTTVSEGNKKQKRKSTAPKQVKQLAHIRELAKMQSGTGEYL